MIGDGAQKRRWSGKPLLQALDHDLSGEYPRFSHLLKKVDGECDEGEDDDVDHAYMTSLQLDKIA